MGAVDVGVQGGELVVERIADKALGRQVVALVGPDLVDHLVDAGIAFERCGMQLHGAHRFQAVRKPILRVLQRHPADNAMNFVSLGKQQLRQVGTVLPRNPGDQSALLGHSTIDGSIRGSGTNPFSLVGGICGSLIRSNGGGSPVRSAREPVRASALCCS